MRIANRFPTRVAASSVVVAAVALAGVQTASAAIPKKAASIVDCTTANTKLTVEEVVRPINHLLLTATNTGTKPCNLDGAPYLAAGEGAQAPPSRGWSPAALRLW
ncbi:DUF4232 domain-containing protein [Streptomyces sp. NPDC002788]